MFKEPFKYLMSDYRQIINSKHDWEHTITENVRHRLRAHLNITFNGICFYCQTDLNQGNAPFEIDHIVHKDKYKLFTFKPENLTFSCRSCNTIKSQQETLELSLQGRSYKYKNYPVNSHDFSIIHAYIDQYDQHIELKDKIFYIAKNGSSKGIATIKICSLHRLKLAEDKSKSILNEIKIKEQAIAGLKTSFSKLYETGTQEQIEDYIKMFSQGLEYLPYLRKIAGNKIVSDLGNEIVKFEGIVSLNRLGIMRVNYFMQHLIQLEKMINLITFAEMSKIIKRKVMNHLSNTGLTELDIDKPFIFNEKSLNLIKNAIQNGDLKINRRVKIQQDFKELLFSVSFSSKDFQKLEYLIKHYDSLKNDIVLINSMLSKKTFMKKLELLNPQAILEIKNDLNEIGDKVFLNLQLEYLTKIDIVYSILKYDAVDIKKIQKLLYRNMTYLT